MMPGSRKARLVAFWCEVFYYVGAYLASLFAAMLVVLLLLAFLAWLDGGL